MPERIGAYRLESPLGRGGMGEVFLAWDERLERAVAIKRIRNDAFAQGHQRERFRREARMAARLSHAAIVQVHDLVSEESGDAIVMEYVEGPTLAERLARGPLALAEVVHLAREIAEGLAAAHEAGLIHRDLKSENVVITPSGHAKILDFGLARPVCWDGEILTQHGALIGTCYAMSPEQASGGDLDERSDLFALGALLYEMLAGCSAFRAKDPRSTLQRVLYEQPRPLAEVRPDLPPALVALVERLLAKDRDDRPRSALHVAHKLERIARELPEEEEEWPERNDDSLSDMPTQAFPSPSGSRTATKVPPAPQVAASSLRRARGWILFLAGALAALVLALVAWYMLGQRPVPPPPAPPALRVLVLRPEIRGARDREMELVQSNVFFSSWRRLSNLKGISVLDSAMAMGSQSPREAALRAAADEVFYSSIEREEKIVKVRLERLQAGDQKRWMEEFSVPATDDLRWDVTQEVEKRLRRAYPEFPSSSDTSLIEVLDNDYADFREVLEHLEDGTLDLPADLDRLDRIVRSSPNFLEAVVLAAELASTQYQSTREPADLQRAEQYVELARKLAPESPRTWEVDFNLALAAQRPDDAESILARLEESHPGEPDILLLRASLEESRGRLKEAEDALLKAVDRAPSWSSMVQLSRLEMRQGRISVARARLEGLIGQGPDNTWAKGQLAYLELIYGNLERAEWLYQELADANPQRSYFTSLGQARSLGRHFEQAEAAYNRALELEPNQVVVMLNLADTKLDLGQTKAAKRLYRQVLGRLDENKIGPHLPPKEEMMRAQCLARLGRAANAREAVQQALTLASDDAERLYEAALVHSVLGDEKEVLIYTKEALERGMPRRWFEGSSAFDPMRGNAEFRALLESDRSEQGH
ncbi:MAG: protein kinase [Acidobacteriota bacterium]